MSEGEIEAAGLSRRPTVTTSVHLIAVADCAATASYFVDVLGFEEHESPDEDWRYVSRGHLVVGIGLCPDVVPAADIEYHRWFAYAQVDDVAALYEEWSERGAEFSLTLSDRPDGSQEFVVVTPDGHQIMFATED